MLNSALPTWAAPQTTGHPLGLPNPSAQPYITTQIAPLRKTSDSALGDSGGRSLGSDTPKPPDDRKNRDQPMAPPSALQLKIISILEEQAEALANDKVFEPTADSEEPKTADSGWNATTTPKADDSKAPQAEAAGSKPHRAYDDALRSMAPDPDAPAALVLPTSPNRDQGHSIRFEPAPSIPA